MKISHYLRREALTRKIERWNEDIARRIGRNDPDTFWRHYSGTWLEYKDYEMYLWGNVLQDLIWGRPLDDSYEALREHERLWNG